MVKLAGFNRMDRLPDKTVPNLNSYWLFWKSRSERKKAKVRGQLDVFGCAITKIVTLGDAIQRYCPVSRDLTGMAESRLF